MGIRSVASVVVVVCVYSCALLLLLSFFSSYPIHEDDGIEIVT